MAPAVLGSSYKTSPLAVAWHDPCFGYPPDARNTEWRDRRGRCYHVHNYGSEPRTSSPLYSYSLFINDAPAGPLSRRRRPSFTSASCILIEISLCTTSLLSITEHGKHRPAGDPRRGPHQIAQHFLTYGTFHLPAIPFGTSSSTASHRDSILGWCDHAKRM